MANFIKFVTGMPFGPSVSASDSSKLRMGRSASLEIKHVDSPDQIEPTYATREDGRTSSAEAPKSEHSSGSDTPIGASMSRTQSLRRALSYRVAMTSRALRRQSQRPIHEDTLTDTGGFSDDIDGSISGKMPVGQIDVTQDRYAGEFSVYEDIQDRTTFEMIRERISTQGVVRPLEAESDLDAFKVPEGLIGTISELAIRRYSDCEAHFRRKFASTYKQIEKTRKKNLEREAKKEGKRLDAFRASASNGSDPSVSSSKFKNNLGGLGSSGNHGVKFRESVINSPGWGYAWALDELERPPPSSIAARRDTEEARKLALIADKAVFEDTNVNANSLWSVMMNSLAPPDRMNGGGKRRDGKKGVDGGNGDEDEDRERTPTRETVLEKQNEREREKAKVKPGSDRKALRTFAHIFSRRESSP